MSLVCRYLTLLLEGCLNIKLNIISYILPLVIRKSRKRFEENRHNVRPNRVKTVPISAQIIHQYHFITTIIITLVIQVHRLTAVNNILKNINSPLKDHII